MQIIGTMTLLNCRPIHEGEGTMISTDDMGQLGAMQIVPKKLHFRLRLQTFADYWDLTLLNCVTLKTWLWTMTTTAGPKGNPEGGGTMISTDDMGQLGAMQIFPEKPHFRLRLLSRVLCSGPKPC